MKRWIAMLLTVCMLISLCPVGVFAEPATGATGEEPAAAPENKEEPTPASEGAENPPAAPAPEGNKNVPAENGGENTPSPEGNGNVPADNGGATGTTGVEPAAAPENKEEPTPASEGAENPPAAPAPEGNKNVPAENGGENTPSPEGNGNVPADNGGATGTTGVEPAAAPENKEEPTPAPEDAKNPPAAPAPEGNKNVPAENGGENTPSPEGNGNVPADNGGATGATGEQNPQPEQKTCTCTKLCAQDAPNTDCEVCKDGDVTNCKGSLAALDDPESLPDDQPVVDIYEFYVDGVLQEDWTQNLQDGEYLSVPGNPAKEGAVFQRWYRLDDAQNRITVEGGTVSGVSGKTVKVYAEFAEFSYVLFMSADGNAVVHTAQGSKGNTVDASDRNAADEMVNLSLSPTQAVVGWSTTKDAATGETIFFAAGTVHVYPVIKNGYWVTFDSKGGNYVAPIFAQEGQTVTLPTTATRSGYTFGGWYQDGQPVTKVSAAATLAARWIAATETEYTVIHWQENADDDGYSFKESETETGTTGDQTAAQAKSYEGFEAQTIKQQTIAGDGSTIVNVYYKRNEYTITFHVYTCGKAEHTHDFGCYLGFVLVCGQQAHKHTDACRGKDIIIKAKHGANISEKWPTVNGSCTWSVNEKFTDGPWQTNIDTMPIGGANFYGPLIASRTVYAYYYVEALPGTSEQAYILHHTDSSAYNGGWLEVTDEDKYPITGFTYKSGPENGESYIDAKFYYTRNSYNIVFINNGTTEKTKPMKFEQSLSGVSYEPNRPDGVPEGYVFDGWYDNKDGVGNAFVFDGKTMPAQNITLYAKWKAPEFTATVYLTVEIGGEKETLSVPYGSSLKNASGYEALMQRVREKNDGKEPSAWFSVDSDGAKKLFNPDTKLYGDVTLVPHFSGPVGTFKVTYIEKDARYDDSNVYQSGSYATVLSPSYGNLRFLYWKDEANGENGKIYKPGESMKMTRDVILTAYYTEAPARVALVYHDGEKTYAENGIRSNDFTKVKSVADVGFTAPAGYTFAGWSTTRGGKAEYFAENTIFVPKDGAHLYAVWAKRTDLSYIVRYLEKGTNEVVHEEKTVNNVAFGTVVTAANEEISIDGYNYDSADKATLTVGTSSNELTLYYTKRTDLSYTVKYLDKNTNEVVHEEKTVNNVAFGTVVTAANEEISIDGYNYDSADKATLTVGTSSNELTLYYTKRTDLSYTVKYLDKNTNEVVHEEKTVNNVAFGTVVTAANEEISIDGYNYDSADKATLTVGTSSNELTLYYTKRTDLSYTVKYLDKDTNEVVHEEKTVNNVAFGTVVTAANEKISIDGYNYDSADKATLTVGTGSNELTLYYTKRTDLSYTVKYLDKNTNEVVHEEKTVNNVAFGTVVTAANEEISIDGYNYDSADKATLTVGTSSNELTLYYTKRTDLSYTVKYLDKNTNEVVHEEKTVNNVAFGTVVTAANEEISIDGYNYDSADKATLTVGTSSNELTLYYTKRTDLSYTVKYLDKDTNEVVHEEKTVNNVAFGTVVTAANEKISIDGYNYDSADKATLTVGTGSNELTLYYTKRTDLSYTVKYLDKNTNEVVHEEKTVNNVAFGTVVTAANEEISIDGYNYDSADKATLTVGTGSNELTLYYTKRTDLSYTVKYLDKDTNEVVHEEKTVNNVAFGTVVTAANEEISIDGYNYDSADKATLTVGTSSNELTLYYTKRTDLSYTVKYLDKNTNEVVHEEKTVNNVAFGTVVTAANEEISIDGYNYDSADKATLTVGTSSNELTLYYTKRTDLSYTVKYLDKDTNEVVHEEKTVNNVAFGTVVTAANEKISIDGYNYDSADKATLTVGTSSNELTLYYTKRTDLTYTVKYLWTDGNGMGSGTAIEGVQDKVVKNVTFGNVIVEGPIDIAGYTPVETGKVESRMDAESKVITFLYYKNVTLTATSDSAVYNGTTQTLSGYTSSEAEAVFEGVTASGSGKDVGEYAVSFSGVSEREQKISKNGRYLLTGTVDGKLTITPATLTVKTESNSKVYDGTALTAPGSISGLVNGETVTFTVTGSQTDVGSSTNTYSIVWGNVKATNYSLTEELGTLTVTAQSITPPVNPDDPNGYLGVQVDSPADHVYDGAEHKWAPTVTDKDGNALTENEDYTVSYSKTDFTNVTGDITVTIRGIGNYTGTVTRSYKITPREAVITVDNASKVFGQNDPAFTGTVSGLVNENDLGAVSYVRTNNAEAVGIYNDVLSAQYTENDNYNVEVKNGTFTITAKSIANLTVDEPTNHEYDGAEHKWAPTVTDKDGKPLTENEDYTVSYGKTDFTNVTGDITVTVQGIGNYTGTVTRSYKITPREAVITVNNGTKTAGRNDPAFTGTVTGLIGENDLGVVSYVRTNNAEAVGTYTDVLTALYTENANYDVRVINGTFVITAANNPNPNPPQPNPNPPQPNPNPPQPQPQPEPEPEVEPEAGPEVEPEVTPEEPQPAAPDAGPVEEIADEETPLAMGGAWALVNLILTVLTVLGSILLLIGYIGKKQKEREDENGNVILNAEGEAETDDIKKKGGWRLASIIPAVAAVIAFILTENMRLPMVLVDKWTLLMVIIALVQLLVAYFSKKKTQEPEQPEQMVANA